MDCTRQDVAQEVMSLTAGKELTLSTTPPIRNRLTLNLLLLSPLAESTSGWEQKPR